MAARKDPRNLPQSYEMQRAKQLLNRLNKCAKGEVEMSRTQVAAAQIVINKEIPDLAKYEHTGNAGGPLKIEVVQFADHQAPR